MIDFFKSLSATTAFISFDCSCGCNHAELVLTDACFKIGFFPCNCPKYRIHTVSLPGLFFDFPISWFAEVHHGTYIQDPIWKTKVEARKKELGNKCTVCSCSYNLDVHHNTYRNIGHELPNDLTVLCRKDHELFTKFGRLPKRTGVYKGRIKLGKRHWIEERSSFILGLTLFSEFSYEIAMRGAFSELEEYFTALYKFLFDEDASTKLMNYFINLCEIKSEWLRIFFPHGVVALQ